MENRPLPTNATVQLWPKTRPSIRMCTFQCRVFRSTMTRSAADNCSNLQLQGFRRRAGQRHVIHSNVRAQTWSVWSRRRMDELFCHAGVTLESRGSSLGSCPFRHSDSAAAHLKRSTWYGFCAGTGLGLSRLVCNYIYSNGGIALKPRKTIIRQSHTL